MWGDDIRAARIAAGLSQSELARRAGVSRKQLTLVEKNRNASIETIGKIAAHLPALRSISFGSRSVQTSRGTRVLDFEALQRHADETVRAAVAMQDLLSNASATLPLMSSSANITMSPSAIEGVDYIEAERGALTQFLPRGKTIDDLPFEEADLQAHVAEFRVEGYVAAGKPIDSDTHDEVVLLPRAFVAENEYVLRARGDSMIEWGIQDGDYIIVERRQIAATGELVIAWYKDGVTVKQWFNKRGRKMLVAGNPDSETFEIQEGEVIEIKGVVTGVWKPTKQIVGTKRVPVDRAPRLRR